jgi:hypothetical protein
MNERKALICAICACDRFFLLREEASSSQMDLVCTGCGTNTTISLGGCPPQPVDTIVEAPE